MPKATSTEASKTRPDFKWPFGIPQKNSGIYLRWGEFVDTDFQFSSFFDKDHTVMFWFMPEFVHAYPGPILAENGTGTYLVGVGNYFWGNVIYNKDVGTNYNKKGDPVLFIQVGQSRAIYLAPEFKEKTWQHIAVVRKSIVSKGSKFKLFVNGKYLTPVTITHNKDSDGAVTSVTVSPAREISVSGALPSEPSGKLRFGRRTTGTSDSRKNWQAYGILDDVGIFDKALTLSEINTIREKRRLTGLERGLLAGWCFDKPDLGEKGLPPKLNSNWSIQQWNNNIGVSSDRNNYSDSLLFASIFMLGVPPIIYSLPFQKNEVWLVTQGMNSELGSHSGDSAFCYDLRLYEKDGVITDPKKEYPEGTQYAPILAASTGKVIMYSQDGSKDLIQNGNIIREGNRIRVKHQDGTWISYMHLANKSLPYMITTGASLNADGYYEFAEGSAPTVHATDPIATVGPNAMHLHIGAKNTMDEPAVTIPLAFSNYMVYDKTTNTWNEIFMGYPQAGALIKRA